MRICLLNDLSHGVWWGGKTTIMGLTELIQKKWPRATIDSLYTPELSNWNEYELGSESDVETVLEKQVSLVVDKLLVLKKYDVVICNGEGTIHDLKPSINGPCNILMALYYSKYVINKTVYLVNCTLASNGKILEFIKKVVSGVDYLAVRDPYSYELMKKIGVEGVVQSVDATYASKFANWAFNKGNKLKGKNVCLCGTSVYGDSPRLAYNDIVNIFTNINCNQQIIALTPKKNHPDIELFKSLNNDNVLHRKICFPAGVIRQLLSCKYMISGRFHINVFCSIVGLPYIPIGGNTYKNDGLNKMLNYEFDTIVIDDNYTSGMILDKLNGSIDYMNNNYSTLRESLRNRFKDMSKLAQCNIS